MREANEMSDPVLGLVAICPRQCATLARPDPELIPVVQLQNETPMLLVLVDVDDVRFDWSFAHFVGGVMRPEEYLRTSTISLSCVCSIETQRSPKVRRPSLSQALRLRITSTFGSARTRNMNSGGAIAP